MTNRPTILLLLLSAPALASCVPMMAASAVSALAQSAQPRALANQGYQPSAREQCSAQAAQYGAVTVIDVEQHGSAKIIVWGIVGEGAQKRSFECDFTTRIVGFKLRPITPSG